MSRVKSTSKNKIANSKSEESNDLLAFACYSIDTVVETDSRGHLRLFFGFAVARS